MTSDALIEASPFGTALRRFRGRAGLTQEELAERAGLSTDAISALERGVRRRAQPKTVRALAAALELTLAERIALIDSATGHSTVHRHNGTKIQTLADRQNALPASPTPLIGRAREVAAALELLAQPEVRLLTMVGPGGVGKTRLALAVASAASDRFEHACFVDLAPVHDPAVVPAVIAHALGLREQGSRDSFESVVTFVQERTVLLLLDNFEHLTAAAPVLADLLAHCPLLVALVTSRAPLHIRGEQELSVPPLAVPDEVEATSSPTATADLLAFPAVNLFVERAMALDPSLDLSTTSVVAVTEICRRLDGLPLAIELAAARTRVLPPMELLGRLSNRLAVLTVGPVDAPARQRTLRSAIDWSYDLLGPEEQQLFCWLSVFAGGFTLAAAEAVGGVGFALGGDAALRGSRPYGPQGEQEDEGLKPSSSSVLPPLSAASPPERSDSPSVLGIVESLVSKNLLRPRTTAATGEPRFDMLETIRVYGLERLAASGQEIAARDAHAAYFVQLAERSVAERIGDQQKALLEQLDAEHPNLRAALNWLIQRGEICTAQRMAFDCAWFWWFRGHNSEGRVLLERLLDLPDSADCLETWAMATGALGSIVRAQGDIPRALRLLEQAVDAWRQLDDDPFHLADALCTFGIVLMYAADARAVPVLSESVAIARQLPDQRWFGGACWALGRAQHYAGDIEGAEAHLAESLAKAHELANPAGIGFSLWALGDLAYDRGDAGNGLALLREALPILSELGDAWSSLLCLEQLAAATSSDDPMRSTRLFAAVDAWREAVAMARPPVEETRHGYWIATLRSALGDPAFATAWQAGLALTPEQAVAEAVALPITSGGAEPPR